MRTPKRICAWCSTTMQDGSEPASHGICQPCHETYFPNEEIPAVLQDTPTTTGQKAAMFTILVGVVVLAGILFFTAGCSSPVTAPTPVPPPAKVCTLVHHDARCTTVFTSAGPVLQCTPAHDGPEQVCQ